MPRSVVPWLSSAGLLGSAIAGCFGAEPAPSRTASGAAAGADAGQGGSSSGAKGRHQGGSGDVMATAGRAPADGGARDDGGGPMTPEPSGSSGEGGAIAGTISRAGEAGSATTPAPGCAVAVRHELSSAIPTVGVVTFSTDLGDLDEARIEFALRAGGPTWVAPVALDAPEHRTLLLGMKAERDYVFRIIARAGKTTCTSHDYSLTTGSAPDSLPQLVQTQLNPRAQAPGFIVTCGGVTPAGGSSSTPAYILDGDGEIVWWTPAPTSTSRARMSWDGQFMWLMASNPHNLGGEVRRVSMDGVDEERNIPGLESSHHDFTLLPDGGLFTALWNTTEVDAPNSLVERRPDGSITTIVPDVAALYVASAFHPNAFHYYPTDDSFTVSDRDANLFVKIEHDGTLVWQFGGTSPLGDAFTVEGDAWFVNHGHQLLGEDRFLFFNNGMPADERSVVREYSLDRSTSNAELVWSYSADVHSPVLGDVQRLPNGNTLVTYSTAGQIHEVDAQGTLVRTIASDSFGYADFRESLYGPPLRP